MSPQLRRTALTGVLAGVQLLAVLDGLAASLALPAIAEDLGLGAAGRAWTLNATSVALAGGLLVAGRIGDLFGRRPVFLTGCVLLAAGSVLAAAAPHSVVLFTGRAVIGLGAAVAYPSALSLTSSLFPDEPWRTRAFAASSVAGASGTIAGAVYGGVISDALGWRWVFWLTVPVALLLFVAATRLLPADVPAGDRERRLDLPGALLATLAVTGLVAAVIGIGTDSAPDAVLLGLGFVAAAAGAALLVWERRCPDPVLPARVLRSRRLAGGSLGIAANSALWSVVVFVLAQQLQQAGWSAAHAGLAILPCSAGIVVAGVLVVPRLRRRLGSVWTAVLGLGTSAVAVSLLGLTPGDPGLVRHLVAPLAMLGLGLSAAATGLTEHTVKESPEGAEAVSAAVFEASTHVGGALAIALYAAVMTVGTFAPAYLMAGACGVMGALGVVFLRRPTPIRMVKRGPPFATMDA
jgi:predicted MFS family arabinose efflux permease